MYLERIAERYVPDDPRQFWDALAGRFEPRELHRRMYSKPRHRRRLRRLLEIAGECAGGRCLELGCAEGLITQELAELFEHVDAVDISAVMIKRCPRLPNVTYYCADADDRLPPGRYDLAVLSEVLEHLRQPKRVIQHIAQTSRWLLATCPITETINSEGAFDLSRYDAPRQVGDATGHIWAMDMNGFLSLFDGLQIVQAEQVERYGIAKVQGLL